MNASFKHVSHETFRRKSSNYRARKYARKDYSRRWIAQYLACLDGTTTLFQERVLDLIHKHQGQLGLVQMFRDMHSVDPGDVIIHAALIAEAVSMRRTERLIRRGCAEIAEPYRHLDGRAA